MQWGHQGIVDRYGDGGDPDAVCNPLDKMREVLGDLIGAVRASVSAPTTAVRDALADAADVLAAADVADAAHPSPSFDQEHAAAFNRALDKSRERINAQAPAPLSTGTSAQGGAFRITFERTGPGRANLAALEWCAHRGISVGPAQGHSPRGLMVGDYQVAKWRNLDARDRARLAGTMTGDMTHGPVTVELVHAPAAVGNPDGR